METSETKTNGIILLGLKGRLDATTSPQLQEKLLAALAGGEKHFAIDCAKLEYISSAGLRVLLLVTKQLRTVSGKMVLYALKPTSKRYLISPASPPRCRCSVRRPTRSQVLTTNVPECLRSR